MISGQENLAFFSKQSLFLHKFSSPKFQPDLLPAPQKKVTKIRNTNCVRHPVEKDVGCGLWFYVSKSKGEKYPKTTPRLRFPPHLGRRSDFSWSFFFPKTAPFFSIFFFCWMFFDGPKNKESQQFQLYIYMNIYRIHSCISLRLVFRIKLHVTNHLSRTLCRCLSTTGMHTQPFTRSRMEIVPPFC